MIPFIHSTAWYLAIAVGRLMAEYEATGDEMLGALVDEFQLQLLEYVNEILGEG
jgi:hypothetical protein